MDNISPADKLGFNYSAFPLQFYGFIVMASNFQPIELQPLDSDDFLPPVSRWTQWGGLLLLGTFGVTVILASFIRYSPGVRVPVVAQPGGNVELVAAETSGIVEQVVVQENQPLSQGEAIAYVDQSVLLTRKRQLQNQVKQLRQELDQLNLYINTLDEQILTTLRSKASRRLRQRFKDMSLELAVVELTKSSPEVAQKLAQERRTLLKQRWQVEKQFLQAQQQLEQTISLIGYRTIRAPIAGTIIQLNLPEPGQIVEADSIIAQIVPTQVPLLFKGWVSERDIARLEKNMVVHLRINVYPFQEYGILKGRVKQISLNGTALQASTRPTSKVYYEVLIQPESKYLMKSNHQYDIYSGMEGTADILVTQEHFLSWVLKKAKLLADF
ncbi:MAG: HlyD family efflux transporter periplasmic adaptor subunit [Cyanobacteriota bacterium]|nr:HlyD family efflux transporter periplasmic adaptor subunit [Cyanobacteriota bacterium]